MLTFLAIIVVIIYFNYQRYCSHQISLLHDEERRKILRIQKKIDAVSWVWIIVGIPFLLLFNLNNSILMITYIIISLLPTVFIKN